jgi:hypothetical protein
MKNNHSAAFLSRVEISGAMPSNNGSSGGHVAFENPVFNRDLYEVNPLHHSNSNNSDLFLASLEEDRRIEASKVVGKKIKKHRRQSKDLCVLKMFTYERY